MLILTQIKVYLYLAFGIAVAAGAFYLYHSGETHQSALDAIALNKAVAAYQVQITTETQRRQKVEADFSTKLDNIKIVNTTITKNLKTELTNTVYTNCKIPEAGIDIINDSVIKLNLARSLSLPTK